MKDTLQCLVQHLYLLTTWRDMSRKPRRTSTRTCDHAVVTMGMERGSQAPASQTHSRRTCKKNVFQPMRWDHKGFKSRFGRMVAPTSVRVQQRSGSLAQFDAAASVLQSKSHFIVAFGLSQSIFLSKMSKPGLTYMPSQTAPALCRPVFCLDTAVILAYVDLRWLLRTVQVRPAELSVLQRMAALILY